MPLPRGGITGTTKENEMLKCKKCHAPVDELAVFPGGICLECYRPEGERIFRTMTADRLAQMWGGNFHDENEDEDEPEDSPTLANCDDWGTGEGRYHGRI
jgi:hypothetical protein